MGDFLIAGRDGNITDDWFYFLDQANIIGFKVLATPHWIPCCCGKVVLLHTLGKGSKIHCNIVAAISHSLHIARGSSVQCLSDDNMIAILMIQGKIWIKSRWITGIQIWLLSLSWSYLRVPMSSQFLICSGTGINPNEGICINETVNSMECHSAKLRDQLIQKLILDGMSANESIYGLGCWFTPQINHKLHLGSASMRKQICLFSWTGMRWLPNADPRIHLFPKYHE